MSISVLVRAMSAGRGRRLVEPLAEALTALLALFMVIWGRGWSARHGTSRSPEFPALSVGRGPTCRSRSAAPSPCSSSPSDC